MIIIGNIFITKSYKLSLLLVKTVINFIHSYIQIVQTYATVWVPIVLNWFWAFVSELSLENIKVSLELLLLLLELFIYTICATIVCLYLLWRALQKRVYLLQAPRFILFELINSNIMQDLSLQSRKLWEFISHFNHQNVLIKFSYAFQINQKIDSHIFRYDEIKNIKNIIFQVRLMVANKFLSIILAIMFNLISTCPYGQYYQFFTKQLIDEFQVKANPYHKTSHQYLQRVQENLNNKIRVCAIKYQKQDKKRYSLKTFDSRIDAEPEGWTVTHQGICGACSTTRDLFVYLSTDLTRSVRKCGIMNSHSHIKLRRCIKNLGFTDACTQIWFWNTINTSKLCFLYCMWSLIVSQPFIVNGELNKCLQCDQDYSGPIFKYESGRTRRNSGIHSEIDRPSDQIYNITHCYY